MTDIFSKNKRSEIMSRIRSTGTSPERRLEGMVREILGPHYRVVSNATGVPGHPDVLVPKLKLAIFADGCFYHSCPIHGHQPKSNQSYWNPKLARTVKRDAGNRRKLRALGYSVWRFWEHYFKGRGVERTYITLERRLSSIQKRRALDPRARTSLTGQ